MSRKVQNINMNTLISAYLQEAHSCVRLPLIITVKKSEIIVCAIVKRIPMFEYNANNNELFYTMDEMELKMGMII